MIGWPHKTVLCLAGGTGLAPLKAIIEAIGHAAGPGGKRRDIVLYHGARTRDGLYDLPEEIA